MVDQQSNPPSASKKRQSSSRKRPELHIALDTSLIYTGSASDLVRKSVKDLIEASRAHGDITIRWWVPDVVVFEREHQMRLAAAAFSPTLEKLERLLGHNLG